jgi:hypothetical protein
VNLGGADATHCQAVDAAENGNNVHVLTAGKDEGGGGVGGAGGI